MPNDYTGFIITMIKRIFANVSWSRLKVAMNLQKILWQNSGLQVVVIFYAFDRQDITTQIHWRGRFAYEIYEIGGVGVCHGKKQV